MGSSLRRIVFQPPDSCSYDNDDSLIWLTTKNYHNIPAYFINRASSLTLLCSHGNAEDLGICMNFFKEVSILWDVNIFAYEYIGYGLSSGIPSEEGVYESIEASFEYLTKHIGISPKSIVCFGRSLGTGACCHLGMKYGNVGGIILQSPLLSVHRIAVNFRFSLPCDMFCNIDKISKIKCPVFIIHGTKDEIVPVFHGMELYKTSKSSVTPYWVIDAGHNNVEIVAKDDYFKNVYAFLRFIENFQHPSNNLEKKGVEIVD